MSAHLVTSRSGRTSRPRDPRPNPKAPKPTGRNLLLSDQGATTNQHFVVYVPDWHFSDGDVALLTEQAHGGERQV